ncbi:MAG: hypothetical protein HOI66_18610 [Verrucomicrobia bacterium]|nr:hypothetical protein [Verrucomicrobiota bacterium]
MAASPLIDEGLGTIEFRFSRTSGLEEPLSISVSAAGDIIQGEDIEPLPASIEFGPMETATSLTIQVIDDDQIEQAEKLNLVFTILNSRYELEFQEFNLKIKDNDRQGKLINEGFNLPDGPISTSAEWNTHSGAPGKTQVLDGALILGGPATEDINTTIPGFPFLPEQNSILYSGFDLTLIQPLAGAGTYFAHFKGASKTSFHSRIYIAPLQEDGQSYQLGVLGGLLNDPSFHTDQLELFTPHRVIMRFDINTGRSDLWINPKDESSIAVQSISQSATPGIESFAFRQTGTNNGGIGRLQIDNLSIGTDFESVHGTKPVLPSISIQTEMSPAFEEKTKAGSWTITRSGDLSKELHVEAGLSGSAIQTADFHILFSPEEIVFEPGEKSIKLLLFPIDDDLVEETETATLTLIYRQGYSIESNSPAIINIRDNDEAQLNPDPVEQPSISINHDRIEATLVPGMKYKLQESDDLNQWETVSEVIGETTPFHHPIEMSQKKMVFFRLITSE